MKAARSNGAMNESGSAAIEFGLAIPLLLTLLMGVVEVGFAMFEAMQVHNAVEAGVHYASKNGFNSTAIAAAVTKATSTQGITATPAPAQFCGCPSVTGITTATCGAACAGGGTAGQYVRISAAIPHQAILPFALLQLPATLTAQSVLRLN